jgi:hypothetical protein
MTTTDTRRPLEDVIGELVESLAGLAAPSSAPGLFASGLELDLPVETVVTDGPAGPVVRADLPQMLTRTAFDRPVGRLRLTISSTATEVAP